MLDKLPNSHFRHITGLRKSVVKSWILNLFLVNLVKCQWYERNIYACFRPKLIFLKTFLSHPTKLFYAPHCQVMHFLKAKLQHYCKHHRLLRTYINLFLSETNEILKKNIISILILNYVVTMYILQFANNLTRWPIKKNKCQRSNFYQL